MTVPRLLCPLSGGRITQTPRTLILQWNQVAEVPSRLFCACACAYCHTKMRVWCIYLTNRWRMAVTCFTFLQIFQAWKREERLCQLVCSRLTTKATVSVTNPASVVGQDDHSGHQLEQQKSGYDMVGPPDPVSNIRPLKLREPTSDHVSTVVAIHELREIL